MKTEQMNLKQKKQRKLHFPIFSCLLYLALATSLVIGITFSRYVTSVFGRAGTEAAKPRFSVGDLTNNVPQSVTVLAPMNASKEAQEYQFDVTNIDGVDIAEVTIGYTVTISSTNNLPLKLTISSPTATPATSANVVCNADGTAKNVSIAGVLNDFTGDTDEYTLKIEWAGSGDAIYSNEIDKINVNIEWQQVD